MNWELLEGFYITPIHKYAIRHPKSNWDRLEGFYADFGIIECNDLWALFCHYWFLYIKINMSLFFPFLNVKFLEYCGLKRFEAFIYKKMMWHRDTASILHELIEFELNWASTLALNLCICELIKSTIVLLLEERKISVCTLIASHSKLSF